MSGGKQTPSEGCWVLTTSHNDYNQHGEYFVTAWPKKPDIEELVKFFKYNGNSKAANVMDALDFVLHVQNGGGRRGTEDQWYELSFVPWGKETE